MTNVRPESMFEIRRILCPVDLSDFSPPVLAHAAALARLYGAEITALHVFAGWFPPAGQATYPRWMMEIPEARQSITEELKTLLDRFDDPGGARRQRQDRAGCLSEYLLRDRAKREAIETRAAVRAHDDQISVQIPRVPDDLARRVPISCPQRECVTTLGCEGIDKRFELLGDGLSGFGNLHHPTWIGGLPLGWEPPSEHMQRRDLGTVETSERRGVGQHRRREVR